MRPSNTGRRRQCSFPLGQVEDETNSDTETDPASDNAVAPQLLSATVDGGTLTLTYNATLDNGVTLSSSAFAVNVDGASRTVVGAGAGQSSVLLLLSPVVESGDTVTVDYTAPDGNDAIQDTGGRKAASFSGRAVTNNTQAADPLTASVSAVPGAQSGEFTFELRFSETPRKKFSYKIMRDHAFTVTGGQVTEARRLVPRSNVGWEIHVQPDGDGTVTIVLPVTTDCTAEGAICTQDGRKLSTSLNLTVPGPGS